MFFKRLLWIPNYPKYWGKTKAIFHAIVRSKQVNDETKIVLFNTLENLRVYGIYLPTNEMNTLNGENLNSDEKNGIRAKSKSHVRKAFVVGVFIYIFLLIVTKGMFVFYSL